MSGVTSWNFQGTQISKWPGGVYSNIAVCYTCWTKTHPPANFEEGN